jgi:hypothetical protein
MDAPIVIALYKYYKMKSIAYDVCYDEKEQDASYRCHLDVE